MADQWYYAREGERLGPVSTEKLEELMSSGEVQPSDLVWKEGMGEWTPASEVEGLVPEAPPGAAPPPVAAGPPPIARPALPGLFAAKGLSESPLWKYLIIAGAGLVFIMFFVPWWSYSFNAEKYDSGKSVKYEKVLRENREWYVDELDEFPPFSSSEDKSEGVWGWHAATGVTGLVFGLLILPLAIVPLFVKVLRPWAWIGSFVSAILGLILFILSLVWIFGCPGQNVSPFFSQGIIVGPYLLLVATLLILGGAVTDTVFGVMAFVARLKSGWAPPG